MLALHNVNTSLHRVLVESVNEEAADDLCLVVQLAKESLLAIAGDTGDGRVSARVLPTKIVAHFSPHGTKLLDD